MPVAYVDIPAGVNDGIIGHPVRSLEGAAIVVFSGAMD